MKHKSLILLGLILMAMAFPSCKTEVQEIITSKVTDNFDNAWKFHAGEGVDSLWTDTTFDDTAWIIVSTDSLLKDKGIKLDNGFGWYRKTVQLSDSLQSAIKEKGAIVLHLGKLAATDEVYFNGKLVGKTGEFPPNYMGYNDGERNYLIGEENINFSGDNLIAIKFHDGWGTGGFLAGAKLSISSAETNDKVSLNVDVADQDYVFMAPDPISIKVNIDNKNTWPVKGNLVVTLTTDNFQPVKTDSSAIKIDGNGTFSHSFELKDPNPGFYRYTVQFKRDTTVVCEKKFNVGFEPEKISSPLDAKADFKEFWDNNLKELAKVAPNYKLIPVPEASKLDYDMYRVEMRSFGNELIQGYYAKPKKEGKHPVIVEYMGYGSLPYFPNQTWDGFAYFVLSIRGQALNLPTNRFGTWITYGLDKKEDYYYRGAFLDVVRALDFVTSRPEIDAEKIAVRGGSQGGALSFVAASLDKRVKVAAPNIPFLSDYRDYFKIVNWPRSDFDNYMKEHPEAKWDNVYDLLTYFDIKNLAQWIECPVLMGIGVQDEVCPPHINFAAYNQVKSEKRWMAFPHHGHSVGSEFHDAMMALFREKLNVQE
ncbi:acetylxylan esterase [Dysgonomonas macrotermitis]|uniref:Cephalosporin-C deacetylase n=1 Tax=Dysgonomonas macrotermitis TaxID=1346286 RepID=A0A1M4T5L0_9BACT|nr:acetylxylan esterase [Dysgonomonas macrotermitis]SHE39711.1 Cephalosporin-C deacetylase [Dysgonomonas macrotermitis]